MVACVDASHRSISSFRVLKSAPPAFPDGDYVFARACHDAVVLHIVYRVASGRFSNVAWGVATIP